MIVRRFHDLSLPFAELIFWMQSRLVGQESLQPQHHGRAPGLFASLLQVSGFRFQPAVLGIHAFPIRSAARVLSPGSDYSKLRMPLEAAGVTCDATYSAARERDSLVLQNCMLSSPSAWALNRMCPLQGQQEDGFPYCVVQSSLIHDMVGA